MLRKICIIVKYPEKYEYVYAIYSIIKNRDQMECKHICPFKTVEKKTAFFYTYHLSYFLTNKKSNFMYILQYNL